MTSGVPLRNESLYLMYRRFFPIHRRMVSLVTTPEEMQDHCSDKIASVEGRVGIMLSGGMDSAMLAHFLPKGSIAYTLEYGEDETALSEFDQAARFVPLGVEHKKIRITRASFFDMARELTLLKREPTVPHDPAIGLAARQALADGITHMVTGVGADGSFGGFGHFYKDVSYAAFRSNIIKQFVAPWDVLKNPVPVDWVIGHYTVNDKVDVQTYLGDVGTEGTAVFDTLQACGLVPVNPYSSMRFGAALDIAGRGGKYPLKDMFALIYPDRKPNKKMALPVPYGPWMRDYIPTRPEFRTDRMDRFGGKNRYQIYALELYMDMRAQFGWSQPTGDRLFMQ